MARSFVTEAIVLKTYDIGEADRFCILFTEARGRIAARARGVRKLKSQLGGLLLPGRHITLMCCEGSTGYYISSAQHASEDDAHSLLQFGRSQYGLELLLTLLEDEEPLPDIFSLTRDFLYRCRENSESPVLSFTVKLLTLSGLFPYTESELFHTLSDDERSFALSCRNEWPTPLSEAKNLTSLCMDLLHDHAGKMLKTPVLVPLMLK